MYLSHAGFIPHHRSSSTIAWCVINLEREYLEDTSPGDFRTIATNEMENGQDSLKTEELIPANKHKATDLQEMIGVVLVDNKG